VISIERHEGRPLRIGHRGAATLAPENTLDSFRAAVEVGVDLVEFDVLARPSGELVVSHSLEEMVPETPTLDDALRFFVEEAPDTGVHLDLKLTRRERDVVAAVRRHGLAGRTFVSSFYLGTARAIAEADGDIRTGITIPRSVLGVSDAGRGASAARIGLGALRRIAPSVVRPLLACTRASAVVIHHSVITGACVRAAHARGAAVVAWTVDRPEDLARMDAAGVDAVVTNDPRIFTPRFVSTLET
jgi:glycerophosphoryl diester phosphodiesterase